MGRIGCTMSGTSADVGCAGTGFSGSKKVFDLIIACSIRGCRV